MSGRAEWIAAELVKPGAVFDGKVHLSSSKKNAKKPGANRVYTMLLEADSEHEAELTELVDSLANGFDRGKAASAPSPLPFG